MDFEKLAAKAKDTIDKRGGMDSLKDKAKRAAEAIKEPGAKPGDGEMRPAQGAGRPQDTPRKGGPPHE